jgi:hypothetical protein
VARKANPFALVASVFPWLIGIQGLLSLPNLPAEISNLVSELATYFHTTTQTVGAIFVMIAILLVATGYGQRAYEAVAE